MPKTKKTKLNHNISGLRNQAKHSPTLSQHATLPQSQVPSSEDEEDEPDLEADNEDLVHLIHFDSLKTNLQTEEENPDELEELENEEMEEWEGFGREDLADWMVDMFLVDDDPNNLDWMPKKMQIKAEKRRTKRVSTHTGIDELSEVDQIRQGNQRNIRKVPMS